ncbi:DUF2279 domain-containing protein [Flavobacterium hydrophilum]|uniref:DUF2279 domain-containing protein n=1 Tax=Flavobacterium hydrophilum TaxID=2211445 RepID=A0A2V4C371_9FLAO|nr:DUF2279 domain-containing protein [Flavobacterium hydrophilum]PXY45625.1 DUF2279 domain-containing protein [Flavobacterium hydrophilum]
MNFKFPFFLLVLSFLSFQAIEAQSKIETFLEPSDTLNKRRQNTVIISEATLASATLIGLNQIWYADYAKSDFHFINDNDEWLQMDKVGHFYSAYHLGRFGAEALNWSGASSKNQLIYGAGIGFVFLTAVEVLDGYSAEWGASSGDLIANAAGTALYVSQELLWKEQRITPKFSFHTTHYAKQNPDKLGSSLNEQILKDYNGQTYWLSVNLYSFAKETKIPKWLNVALGYGGEAMLSGNNKNENLVLGQKVENFRQIYLSFDVNLAKINTKSHFLKTVFSIFNTIKIPAPTLEYTANKGLKGHLIYF